MRHFVIFLSLALGSFVSSCQPKAVVATATHREVVGEAEVVPGHYGDLVEATSAISPGELVSRLSNSGTYQGKIMGIIDEVCTKKGCWFAMKLPDGNSMRVTFKDYGFFIPTNSQGFPIVLEGVAKVTETDVETLRHYVEDQGKTKQEVEAIMAPKKEITFEATGVLIQEKR